MTSRKTKAAGNGKPRPNATKLATSEKCPNCQTSRDCCIACGRSPPLCNDKYYNKPHRRRAAKPKGRTVGTAKPTRKPTAPPAPNKPPTKRPTPDFKEWKKKRAKKKNEAKAKKKENGDKAKAKKKAAKQKEKAPKKEKKDKAKAKKNAAKQKKKAAKKENGDKTKARKKANKKKKKKNELTKMAQLREMAQAQLTKTVQAGDSTSVDANAITN